MDRLSIVSTGAGDTLPVVVLSFASSRGFVFDEDVVATGVVEPVRSPLKGDLSPSRPERLPCRERSGLELKSFLDAFVEGLSSTVIVEVELCSDAFETGLNVGPLSSSGLPPPLSLLLVVAAAAAVRVSLGGPSP